MSHAFSSRYFKIQTLIWDIERTIATLQADSRQLKMHNKQQGAMAQYRMQTKNSSEHLSFRHQRWSRSILYE
jgi:hypothetical protein